MIRKTTQIFKRVITSVIIFLFLYLALNIVVVAGAGTILKHFSTENFEIKIGKVNSLLLPFYVSASDIYIRYGTFELNIGGVAASVSLKRFMDSRPFVSLETTDSKLILPTEPVASSEKENSNIFEYLGIIKSIKLNRSHVGTNHSEVDVDIQVKQFAYNGDSGIYQVDIDRSVLRRGDISEALSGISKGRITSDRIQLDYFNIRGESIYLASEGFFISRNGMNGEISGAVGSDLLKIINPDLSGSINMRCRVVKDYVTLSFATENMMLKEHHIEIDGRAGGRFPGQIDFKLEKLNLLDYAFEIEGQYDTVSTDLKTKIDFIKPINIYKGHGWHVYIKDADIAGKVKENNLKVKTAVTSVETYQAEFNAVFDLANGQVKLENLKGKSASSTLYGSAVSDFKGIVINAKGHVKNNGEVIKILQLTHDADVDLKFSVDFNHLRLTGSFFSDTPQQLYNVGVKAVEGTYDLTYEGVNFKADAIVDEGTLNIDGSVDFENFQSQFDFDIENTYFSSILDYFELDTSFDIPVIGKAVVTIDNGSVSSTGNFSAYEDYLPENSMTYSFAKGLLSIDTLTLDEQLIASPVLFDFNQMQVKGLVDLASYQYRTAPALKSFHMVISGDIRDPQVDGDFYVDLDGFRDSKVDLSGDIDHLAFLLNRSDIDISAKHMLKEWKFSSELQFKDYILDNQTNIQATGVVFLKSDDLNQYFAQSELIDLSLEGFNVSLDNVTFETDLTSITKGKANTHGPWWQNVQLYDFGLSKEKIAGELAFKSSYLKYGDFEIQPIGKVYLRYDYDKPVQVFGKLQLAGELSYEPLKVRLPVANGVVEFFGEQVDVTAEGTELDMTYETHYHAERYTDYLNSNFKFYGQNVYLSTKGLSSILDIDAVYDGREKKLNAEIFLVDSKLLPVISELSTQGETLNIPIEIDANIQTRNDVLVENKFFKSALQVGLNVKYFNDELVLDGKIKSSRASLDIAGNRFLVDEGFLSFRPGTPPYIFMEADGTGVQRSIHMKVDGFLPDYNVELLDRNPNNANYVEADSNILRKKHTDTKSKFIVTEIMNGAILSSMVNVTEKLFGINRIGFEENRYQGESSNYIKVGKRFSDRMEVKYVIGTGRDDENAIVGEYLLLDWFKMIVYTAANGGNGAGFTFFTNF